MPNSIKKQKDRLQFKIKRHFVEVLKTTTSDRSIAAGFAIGTLITMLPTPGVSTLLCILLIAIFKRINKLSVFVALALWNVWTLIPFYWLSLEIGEYIFKDAPTIHFELESFNELYQYSRRFIVGSFIISIPFSALCYFVTLWGVGKFRKNRAHKTPM